MVLLGVCEGRVRNLASPFLWFSYCVSHNNLASGIIRWRKTWGLLLTGGGAVPALLSAYIKARLCLTGPIIVAGSMQHTLTLACPWKFPKVPMFTGSWYNPKRQQMTVFNTYLTISPASGWGVSVPQGSLGSSFPLSGLSWGNQHQNIRNFDYCGERLKTNSKCLEQKNGIS